MLSEHPAARIPSPEVLEAGEHIYRPRLCSARRAIILLPLTSISSPDSPQYLRSQRTIHGDSGESVVSLGRSEASRRTRADCASEKYAFVLLPAVLGCRRRRTLRVKATSKRACPLYRTRNVYVTGFNNDLLLKQVAFIRSLLFSRPAAPVAPITARPTTDMAASSSHAYIFLRHLPR